MPPSAFPSLSTIRPSYYDELLASYAVTKSPKFADGGCDFNLDADQKERRFVLRYMVSTTDAATIIAHAESAKYSEDEGSAYGFNFTTRDGETVANVHYDKGGFQCSHTRAWRMLEIRLIKYP